MKNRQLKQAVEDARTRGLALLRMGEIERAHEEFQVADWLAELLVRRLNPLEARTLNPPV